MYCLFFSTFYLREFQSLGDGFENRAQRGERDEDGGLRVRCKCLRHRLVCGDENFLKFRALFSSFQKLMSFGNLLCSQKSSQSIVRAPSARSSTSACCRRWRGRSTRQPRARHDDTRSRNPTCPGTYIHMECWSLSSDFDLYFNPFSSFFQKWMDLFPSKFFLNFRHPPTWMAFICCPQMMAFVSRSKRLA